jgi:hypothetical protein
MGIVGCLGIFILRSRARLGLRLGKAMVEAFEGGGGVLNNGMVVTVRA